MCQHFKSTAQLLTEIISLLVQTEKSWSREKVKHLLLSPAVISQHFCLPPVFPDILILSLLAQVSPLQSPLSLLILPRR